MVFPDGWQRKASILVDHTRVIGAGAALFDFPLLLTQATLPAEMFDADGPNPAQNGGGDIRFTSDEGGSSPIPLEVVSFVTDPDPANGSAEVWVKVPTLDKDADTAIYVWWNTDTTASQPAVDDPNGRNAVWTDYYAVFHLADLTDSTGNVDLTVEGAAPSASSTGPIGSGFAYTGDGNHISKPDPFPLTDTPFTLQAAGTEDVNSSLEEPVLSVARTASPGGRHMGIRLRGESVVGSMELVEPVNNRVIATDSTGHAGNNKAFFLNSSWAENDTITNHLFYDSSKGRDSVVNDFDAATASEYDAFGVGAFVDASPEVGNDFTLDEVRFAKTVLSEDWLDTEFANYSDPGTFATAGVVQDAGGGGAVTASMSATVAGAIAAVIATSRNVGIGDLLTGGIEAAVAGSIANRGSVSGKLGSLRAALGQAAAVDAEVAAGLASVEAAGQAVARFRATAWMRAPAALSNGTGGLRAVASISVFSPELTCGATGSLPQAFFPSSERELGAEASVRTHKFRKTPRMITAAAGRRKIT